MWQSAAAIAIALELGCRVVGIDLFEPFIDHAKTAARQAGVGALCSFLHGDIARLAGTIEAGDAVVFAALGDVLGPLEQTARIVGDYFVRDYLKPRGYFLINDCYVRDAASPDFDGFRHSVSLLPRDRPAPDCLG